MDDADTTPPRPEGLEGPERPERPGSPTGPGWLDERDASTVVHRRIVARPDDAELSAERSDDTDATVIRNTVLQPRSAVDDALALQRRTTRRPLPKRALALPPGLRLHEYRIERVLGQGGFGITYLATDVNLDAQVAIKEYLPEEIAFRASDRSVRPNASSHRDRYLQGLDNFLAEARTLASFRHPNIVRVARFFEAHHTAYMVLEYERGASFKKWWLRQDPQRPGGGGERLLIERLQPLLDGLATVHAAGFLHRDIKPDNIQVRAEDGRMVLLDFGSAGQTVALADQDAVVVTPGYAPLEQYGIGEQGAWTDVYALAATLYWAVAGRKPPDAEARAAGVPLLPAAEAGKGRYGRSFLEAIDSALEPDPLARPRSVDAWSARLLADHVASPGPAPPPSHDDSRLDDDVFAPPRPRGRMRLRSRWRRWGTPSAWPLAAKLTVGLLATTWLPLLLLGLYCLHAAEQALQLAQMQAAEPLARSVASGLEQLLTDRLHLTQGLAADAGLAALLAQPAAAEPNARPVQQRLDTWVRAHPDIQQGWLVDTAGSMRVSTDPQRQAPPPALERKLKVVLAGQAAGAGIAVDASTGAATVFFTAPVHEAGGPLRGAVLLQLRAAAIDALLQPARLGAEWTPWLLDGDGLLLHHPQPERRLHSLVPLPPAAQARLRDQQGLRRDRVGALDEDSLATLLATAGRRASGHGLYRPRGSGQQALAAFAAVPVPGWTLVLTQPWQPGSRLEQPLARLWLGFFASLVVLGLLVAALALWWVRRIVRPLRALTAGTQALKVGLFEQAYVEARGRDELGRLARSFNVMVDVLRQRDRERSSRR